MPLDEKTEGDNESPPPKRRIYRSGSQYGSQHLGDIELLEKNPEDAVETKSAGGRSRTPSGRSVKSRTATRAEYHEDLKGALVQGVNRNLLFQAFVIVMGNSFLFGYNIGVLNQPAELIKTFYNVTYSERWGLSHNTAPANTEPFTTASSLFDDVLTTILAGDSERNGSEINGTAPATAGIDKYTLTFLWSLTTTTFVVGGMIGAYAAGFIADRLGRKRACLVCLLPAFIGAGISTLCVVLKAPEVLMVGRFFTGIHCGCATQLAPMFLLEISPYNLKGAFGTANQLFITVGILAASVLGLSSILGTVQGWPYLLLINAVPAGFSLVCLPFLPDSPRYLMLVRRNRIAAEKSLRFLRRTRDVLADIEEMETELSEAQQNKGALAAGGAREEYTMKKLLMTRDLRKPLLIAMFLNLIQQLSGINAIFFYSTEIYKNAGVQVEYIEYANVATVLINVVMTIIAVWVMDKAGRRPLLLYPMSAMIIILGVITIALTTQLILPWMSYVSIACVLGYVICFALGLGPIPVMIAAELFRQGPRPRAMSLAGLTNWVFTAVIAMCFNLVQELTQNYTFLIFFVLMIGFTLFVYFLVPETKNKTFEEIASAFQPGGEIEVDEVIEDPIYKATDDLDSERGPGDSLVASSNGAIPSTRVQMELKPENGEEKMADEERRSLMKSDENTRTVAV